MVRRPNYRGRPVLFPLGALLLVAALAALALAPSRWLVFLAGVGALGLIDDLADGAPRGLRGHGRALLRGELSTGAVKAAGTLAIAVYAAEGTGATGAELAAEVGVLTLSAHLGNLVDTRPGRCEKTLALVAASACVVTGSLAPLEPVAALPVAVALGAWLTLRERAMLGDTGASMTGGMVGVLIVTSTSTVGSALTLVILAGVALYGETRSISVAIERLPLLRRLDSLGRVT